MLSYVNSIVPATAFGATGDGVTDDTSKIQLVIDYCFGPANNPNGINYTANKVLFFPPGRFRITSPLSFTYLQGAKIIGSGRFCSTIENTAGGNVFNINGCAYAQFEGLYLLSSGGATVLDLNADGLNNRTSLQSNSFRDMFFEGGHVGVAIGAGGFQGSENLFQNCFWESNLQAGITTNNPNALQNTVIGGNFQGCGIGIWMFGGSVTAVHSVGFQQSVNYDIRSDYSARDRMSIAGCRTESDNFLYDVMGCDISAVTHTGNGQFINCYGTEISLRNCISNNGYILARYCARMNISGCSFGRGSDWIQYVDLWRPVNNAAPANIELENICFNFSAMPNNNSFIDRQRVAPDPATGSPITYRYSVS